MYASATGLFLFKPAIVAAAQAQSCGLSRSTEMTVMRICNELGTLIFKWFELAITATNLINGKISVAFTPLISANSVYLEKWFETNSLKSVFALIMS